ncbi:MAG: hypothetical protein K6F69_08145 [Treponema sp.]|nr:hypothetical protein [Treponema sp.]
MNKYKKLSFILILFFAATYISGTKTFAVELSYINPNQSSIEIMILDDSGSVENATVEVVQNNFVYSINVNTSDLNDIQLPIESEAKCNLYINGRLAYNNDVILEKGKVLRLNYTYLDEQNHITDNKITRIDYKYIFFIILLLIIIAIVWETRQESKNKD